LNGVSCNNNSSKITVSYAADGTVTLKCAPTFQAGSVELVMIIDWVSCASAGTCQCADTSQPCGGFGTVDVSVGNTCSLPTPLGLNEECFYPNVASGTFVTFTARPGPLFNVVSGATSKFTGWNNSLCSPNPTTDPICTFMVNAGTQGTSQGFVVGFSP
jgi:hypothetical protein